MSMNEALACDQRRVKAFLSGDLDTLWELFHEDLIWVHTAGTIDDRSGFIDKLSRGTLKFLAITPSDVRATISDSLVVISGAQTIDVEMRGTRALLDSRYSNTWTLTPDGWRMIYWQSTAVPRNEADGVPIGAESSR